MNRRDFFKVLAIGVAAMATPKQIMQIEAPKAIPPELYIAMTRRSTLHLDNLGISVTGLTYDNFEEEALKRYFELL